ncbi:putative cobalt/nickel-exporting P-type ATPase [Mycobacterium marinum]|uniref:heavy metal translocating P-type ATPase n=1 Tax=Mycobacterium marinum TaxID=1781 RepID=UPI00035880E3|nr:heavy metal translocating P-type ATPase [Mycobacterium marinum]AXN44212.1 putative cobalt/nickel-exporting P-type ATPase [Mycobacterium marinum]AXN49582.1 putative cobalt/nickel-exporting P-type ATPase [Mycobacterium marinum]EPQ79893.1 Lead, cadmium, zinc and mercury transporting ATPase [Mycobacterium marinum str. Europe]RFZ02288.1 putative cobalt/nickel-exporting P-type ATPase [Mycobacterium marinum]RFZ03127.1 putative cobalt/nickel-exporting P-type ATPase [Mycobacterium marinum]
MTLTAFEVSAAEASSDRLDRIPSTSVRPLTWRAALWSVMSVRWAGFALALFLTGLVAQLNGAAQPVWWTLYLACYLAGGWGSAWAGAQALRNRALDVDLLMIVAAIGAVAIGQIFDGALLIVIFATSGALDDVATKHTADSVKGLLDLAPEQATVFDVDGNEQVVAASELVVGDRVVVRPGERIPADGAVLSGCSEVDQRSITGESMPAAKGRGDEVFAGTVNGSGVLQLLVTRDPSQTVVARIVELVSEASATKAKTQLFIEKIEQRYSIGVVIATLALIAIPLMLGVPVQVVLLRAMTFMIVASPCAVVLATMPPLLSAIANAGRHGVLVKSAIVVEHLADTGVVALDKTGTLTFGLPQLAIVEPLSADVGIKKLLQLAAAAEQSSEHPLGRAIVEEVRRRGVTIPGAEDFRALPGRGVRASVGRDFVEVCSPHSYRGAPLPELAPILEAGATAAIVLRNGVAIGVLGLTDQVRADAAPSVAALTALTSAPPVLLTGDNPCAAQRVAQHAGITDVRAALLPEQKVEAVQALQAGGHRVLVVGDGVNDAPAMAAAHTSVAMGAGADLTLQTADGVTVRDELHTIPTLIGLARQARRVVIANLFIAGTFISVLVLWDLFGQLPLPLGVAGHEGSTVLVALNGMRLLTNRSWRAAASPVR